VTTFIGNGEESHTHAFLIDPHVKSKKFGRLDLEKIICNERSRPIGSFSTSPMSTRANLATGLAFNELALIHFVIRVRLVS